MRKTSKFSQLQMRHLRFRGTAQRAPPALPNRPPAVRSNFAILLSNVSDIWVSQKRKWNLKRSFWKLPKLFDQLRRLAPATNQRPLSFVSLIAPPARRRWMADRATGCLACSNQNDLLHGVITPKEIIILKESVWNCWAITYASEASVSRQMIAVIFGKELAIRKLSWKLAWKTNPPRPFFQAASRLSWLFHKAGFSGPPKRFHKTTATALTSRLHMCDGLR